MIEKAQVARLAKLAKLKFSDQEMEVFASKFGNILDMIDKITQVDCSGIEPLTSISKEKILTRVDQVTDGRVQSQLFKNAPGKNALLAKEVNCFIVPKVIE